MFAVATFRNNVMTNCSTGSVASPSWGAHAAVDADGSTPHVHSNNTYWTPNSGDTAINLNGSITTRANVVSNYEASAVQVDPKTLTAPSCRAPRLEETTVPILPGKDSTPDFKSPPLFSREK